MLTYNAFVYYIEEATTLMKKFEGKKEISKQ